MGGVGRGREMRARLCNDCIRGFMAVLHSAYSGGCCVGKGYVAAVPCACCHYPRNLKVMRATRRACLQQRHLRG
jgi:hypothetical protein